ncbi:MAG: hypothetical protein LBE91_16295, partial [Tannerella sp.]|nr:hypothetical protein [Tannerella sp.]
MNVLHNRKDSLHPVREAKASPNPSEGGGFPPLWGGLEGDIFYRGIIPAGLHIYSHECSRFCATPSGSYGDVATSVYKYMTALRS